MCIVTLRAAEMLLAAPMVRPTDEVCLSAAVACCADLALCLFGYIAFSATEVPLAAEVVCPCYGVFFSAPIAYPLKASALSSEPRALVATIVACSSLINRHC
ncbi:MAG: hypothetical protein WC248_03920 [Candidatus Methanomethylophilaceae archaeon]